MIHNWFEQSLYTESLNVHLPFCTNVSRRKVDQQEWLLPCHLSLELEKYWKCI